MAYVLLASAVLLRANAAYAAGEDGADLALTKTADRKSVRIGENVTYTITLTNRGPAPATDMEFGDSVPEQGASTSQPFESADTDHGNAYSKDCPMTDAEQIAALLEEAAETHHRVYRITDGVDDDWASWYADWLLRLSELPSIVGSAPVRSELVYMLVKLDKDHTGAAPQSPGPSLRDPPARPLPSG